MTKTDSSNLDSLETSGDSRPPESYRKYCLANCQDEHVATGNAYAVFDKSHGGNRLEAFQNCRTGAWFARNKITGMIKVLSSSCKLRWCPMCSSTRRWFLSQQVSSWLVGTSNPKFLTLTLQHSDLPLQAQIDTLYQSFQKYRKLNLLKRAVSGGVWFFQIHKAKSDKLWHPHLHCVIDSVWIDKYDLSTAWEFVTKSSKIINIKEVKDPESMSEYVARYAARPSMLSRLDGVDRKELIESLHGRRLVGTWGTARAITLRPSKPPDSESWVSVGSYSLVREMLGSDVRADTIWNCFKNSTVCPEDCNLQDIEDFIDGRVRYDYKTVDDHAQLLLDFY